MGLGLRAGLRMVQTLLTGATLDKIGAGLRASRFCGWNELASGPGWAVCRCFELSSDSRVLRWWREVDACKPTHDDDAVMNGAPGRQQRLPNPLRKTHPGTTRTFLQQGVLRPLTLVPTDFVRRGGFIEHRLGWLWGRGRTRPMRH